MNKLSKSQKKGKVSSYTNRYLKNKDVVSSYSFLNDTTKTYKVIGFKKATKSTAVMAKVLCLETNKRFYIPCAEKVKSDTFINSVDQDCLTIKPLNEILMGQKISAIEYYKNRNKFICCAPGTWATISSQNIEKDTTTILVNKRSITLPATNKAMLNPINSSNFYLKPIGFAGTASKIAYAKGKKYPTVSEHKKNALDSVIGGSYKKKKRIICVSHDTPPRKKTGHISPSRNGRKKK